MFKKLIKTLICAFFGCLILTSCKIDIDKDYGVFLSVTENLNKLSDYNTVVIDAQYFSKEEITTFKNEGHSVYTYINIGSIEDFRDYYDDYKDLIISKYENWEEEYWIDVSSNIWQDFIINDLMIRLLDKNIDGFFVDNTDVYYNYPTDEIKEGLTNIMKELVKTKKKVLINGGDSYLDSYCNSGGKYSDVITGINQETVFSKILWDDDKFSTADEEDRLYFTNYIEKYASLGAGIYLLEYTRSNKLIKKIKDYCNKKNFKYYVSDSLELD